MARDIKDIFNFTPKYDEAGYVKEKYHEDLFKVRKVPYSKDDMKLLKKLMGHKFHSNFRNSSFGGGRNIDCVNQKNQRVTFKMSYSPKLDVHKAYLSTYMPQENKSQVEIKPVLFGTDNEEYEKNMVGKHYKCILSPENQNVDLKVLCSQFIKRIETMTGFKLYWQGAIHNDTEHKHAHICINGKDKNGREVYFQPEMIQRTMRETLSYIATQMVGERTDTEIIAARENLVNAKRWTRLDNSIENYSDKISIRMVDTEIQNRLAFLSKIGLATKKEKYYQLKKNWKEALVATGRFNTYLSEYNEYNGNLELFKGGIITGEVQKVINFDKDESWNDALIVKQNGKNYYVPVAQLKIENLHGKRIYINTKETEKLRKVRNDEINIIESKKDKDFERN